LREIIFDLSISSDEYLKVYRGEAKFVFATSRDGLKVQFPAGILRRFVTKSGVHGSFAVLIDDDNRFQGIRLL
jgi:lipocalin